MTDIERRLAAAEREIVALREQMTDTHTLAAHADRDVAEFRAELRAQTRLINAVRETQAEHGTTIAAHYAEHKADAAEIKAGLRQIIDLLQHLGGGEANRA